MRNNRQRSFWPLVPDRGEQKGFIVLSILFFAWSGMSMVVGYHGGEAKEDPLTGCRAKTHVNEDPPGRIEEIPGIGIVRAKRIVAYRKRNGPFRSFDGLRKVSGIGPKTTEKIRRHARLRPCHSN